MKTTTQQGNKTKKTRLGESLKKWESKAMHGQDIVSTDRQLISEEDTFLWLSRGDLKGETEITVAQNQALPKKITKKNNMNRNSKCRLR
jgi:hypothetical protein